MEFELKQEHITLLRSAYWRWEDCEFGSPAIDCKRPFGNSDVIGDIIEILEVEERRCPHCGELIEDNRDKYNELYSGLLTAIEIIMDTMTFRPGIYIRKNGYGKEKWSLKSV